MRFTYLRAYTAPNTDPGWHDDLRRATEAYAVTLAQGGNTASAGLYAADVLQRDAYKDWTAEQINLAVTALAYAFQAARDVAADREN